MKGFNIELVDDRSAAALHDAWDVNLGGSECLIGFETNRQVKSLIEFRACGRENREKIAQRDARLARNNRFESDPLPFIRTLVDHDLALAVSIFDLAGPLVKARPLEAREQRIVEVAFNNVANEGRLTIAVCTGQVELTTTIHSAITVIIRFALEDSSIRHNS